MPCIWKWYYLAALMLCSQLIRAENRDVFSAPDSTLLFGWYGELRAVTPDEVVAIEPPSKVPANDGALVFPSISPKGDNDYMGICCRTSQCRGRQTIRNTIC